MVANGLLQPERQLGVTRPVRAEFRVVYAHAEGLGLDGWNTLVDRQRHRFQKALFPPAIEQQAPQIVQDAGLTGESGWIPVNRGTLETRFPGVYAVGDVTGIPLSMGKPLPKAGVFAHGEAEVVANNIVYAITGKGKPTVFNGHGECFIETGDGKAGFGSGDFFAEPVPKVKMRGPNRALHFGKVAFEKFWLFEWF